MHQNNRAAKSFKERTSERVSQEEPSWHHNQLCDQERSVHVQGYTHLGAIRAGCGADLKAFPKLHTDPSTQGKSLRRTRGFNTTCDQTLIEQ